MRGRLWAAPFGAIPLAVSALAGGADAPRGSTESSDLEAEIGALAAELEGDSNAPNKAGPAGEGPRPRSSGAVGRAAPLAPERAAQTASVENSSQVDEVTVTAARLRRAPGSVHVVGEVELERFQYDDPHATFQLVPGVYVRQEDGFGLRPNIGIRGAISDRSKKVALLQDGVLLGPAPYSAPAAYYFPIIGRMQSVRVTKGPAAVKYGPQSVGGAIDLRTRAIPPDSAGALTAAGGQFGFGKLHGHYGARSGRSAYLVEGVHLRSSGFKQLPGEGDTGFYRNEWMFKGQRDIRRTGDTQHELFLQLTYSNEGSHETYLGLSDEDFARDPNQRYEASRLDRMSWHRTSGTVTHRLALSRGLSFETTAYRHDLSRKWNKVNHFGGASLFDVLGDPSTPRNQVFFEVLTGEADGASPQEQLYIGPNERHYVSQGIQSVGVLEHTGGWVQSRLEWGLRFHHDSIRRVHTEDAYDLLAGEPSLAGGPTVLTTSNTASTQALAIHVSEELRIGGLTLTPGMRAELIASEVEDLRSLPEASIEPMQRGARVLFMPGVGVHYALTKGLGILAGVHRGTSPPPPGSGDNVRPESSLNYEAGARFAAGVRRAELIGYFNDYQNMTNVCTLSGGCSEQNLDQQFDAGRARVYGLEASAEDLWFFGGGGMPSFSIPVRFNYTLTMAEFMETFQSRDPIFGQVTRGDQLPYVPRHQLRASLGLETLAAGGNVAVSYAGRMREQASAGSLGSVLATGSLLTWDAGVHYQATDAVRVYAQGRNLLGRQEIVSRRPYGARPNAPRWLQAGVHVDLN